MRIRAALFLGDAVRPRLLDQGQITSPDQPASAAGLATGKLDISPLRWCAKSPGRQ